MADLWPAMLWKKNGPWINEHIVNHYTRRILKWRNTIAKNVVSEQYMIKIQNPFLAGFGNGI